MCGVTGTAGAMALEESKMKIQDHSSVLQVPGDWRLTGPGQRRRWETRTRETSQGVNTLRVHANPLREGAQICGEEVRGGGECLPQGETKPGFGSSSSEYKSLPQGKTQ